MDIYHQTNMRTRIMYIEYKGEELTGDAHIGRVKFSKSMKSIHYNRKTFKTLKGQGFKANFFDIETGEHYWISGCRKDGADRLYGERLPIYIDQDVQEEYWTDIRNLPEMVGTTIINEKNECQQVTKNVLLGGFGGAPTTCTNRKPF